VDDLPPNLLDNKGIKNISHQTRTAIAAVCECVQVGTVSVWEQERCTRKVQMRKWKML